MNPPTGGSPAIVSACQAIPGYPIVNSRLFHLPAITSHQQITDIYVLALSVSNHGKLATLDRSIPLKAVLGATPKHIALISSLL